MAEIVLSPLLQVIFDRVASPVLQRLGDAWDLKDNLKKLQHVLLMVQAILEDAEQQQVTRKAVKIWLSRLQDAAYDAQDLLDDFAAKASGVSKSISTVKVRNAFQAFEMTAIEGLSLNLKEGSIINYSSYDKRETGSFIVESQIYGREEDREKIVKILLSSEATQEGNVTVIPIIGIGGIGKTTLAQLAYNDERTTQHFDVKIWVFVSENFDTKRILKTVLESATNGAISGVTEMDILQSKLCGLLHKKRYLIVLDDVWTEDQDEWDKLRLIFSVGVAGSKIIITTRSKKVGMVMYSPTIPYHLKGLVNDDCWALFKQRAFQRGEEEKYPNLLPIGMQIVEKCGGLPLAAKSLGSLMRFKREEREWLLVKDSGLWSLNIGHAGILPSLMLSYHHLPSQLKRCFLFCSIFPKNYEIRKEKLIYIWMAERLIPLEAGKRPEDIGNEYFNDLLWMCFFQEVEKSNNDSIAIYKMHDVIHDLARYVAGKEFVILEHCLPSSSLLQTRHSSVICKFGSFAVPEALYEAEHLQTLLLIVGGDLQEVPSKLLSSFKNLRVLDMNNCGLTKLHESVGSLTFLRFLDLSYTYIRILPETIRNLCLLQTLNLHGCSELKRLPNLAPMADLRHLIITECKKLVNVPYGIMGLRQLQSLPLFIVPERSLHHLKPVGPLKPLENLDLCGELKIKHLENLRHAEGAQRANMRIKKNLESLELHWNVDPERRETLQDAATAEGILEALQPHENLKRLHIEGYHGTKFPHWMPNLMVLRLTSCKKCENLPALGNLMLLQSLFLCGMDGVKRIGKEFYGEGTRRPFPSLEELQLRCFPNLEEWSTADYGNAFPKLTKLFVDDCPNLTNMLLFHSLKHLGIWNCNQNLMLSIEILTSLSTLSIKRIPELFSVPGSFVAANTLLTSLEILSCPELCLLPSELGSLTCLKSLSIRWCEKLQSLPQSLQNLKALECLEISECHSMISLPDNGLGGLSLLRTLSIENCNNMASISSSLQHLTSLENLTIMYCPSLSSLPEGLQYLSALRSLSILSCPLFLSLPEELKYVTTLHCLEIQSCPGLAALPEWFSNLASLRSLTISDCHNIKFLPESLKLLTALQHLSIQDCPELEKRSKQESGEDWPKIAHIPYKHIGLPIFEKSAESSSSAEPSSFLDSFFNF